MAALSPFISPASTTLQSRQVKRTPPRPHKIPLMNLMFES